MVVTLYLPDFLLIIKATLLQSANRNISQMPLYYRKDQSFRGFCPLRIGTRSLCIIMLLIVLYHLGQKYLLHVLHFEG